MIEDNFSLDEVACTEPQKIVSAHLSARGRTWAARGVPDLFFLIGDCTEEVMTVAVDVSDRTLSPGLVLRTLRVDLLDGRRALVGDDETCQLSTRLVAGGPGVALLEAANPTSTANVIADWFEQQIQRVVLRQVWGMGTYRYTRYLMADDGRVLSVSGRRPTANSDDVGAPDSSTVVWPPGPWK